MNPFLKMTLNLPAFTYQGHLSDNGSPANGNYDLRFSIYDSASGGSAVSDSISASALGVSNGLFAVTLDFGAGVFDGNARWLEISARTNGAVDFTTLNPRQPLTPAPTAIFAGTAATALGISGPLPSASLTGVYGNAVNFNNPSNAFSGDGANLSNISGALPPQLQSGITVQAVPNTSYVLTNSQPVTVTLPPAPKIGDVIRIAGTGSGGWTLAQNPGQSVFGQNLVSPLTPWTNILNGPSYPAFTVTSSADGVHLIVGTTAFLEISSDSGATWSTPSSQPSGAARVAISTDGRYAAAAIASANRWIYTSSDFGGSWTAQTNSFMANYVGIASSADGSRLVAIANAGGIYTSANFGTNWILTSAPSNAWVSVTSSADGSRLAAASSGGIYLSADFGATWQFSTAPHPDSWTAITSSFDGARILAFDNSTNAWLSTDAGQHWESSFIGGIGGGSVYSTAACSTDGLRAAVAFGGGDIYLSTDGGLTWFHSHAPALAWRAIASSTIGNFIAVNNAVSSGFGVYAFKASTTTGTTGYLSGGPYAAVELQYVGNGQFLPINHEGTLLTH